MNESGAQGVSGTLLATPPGTCTGVPGPAGTGAIGNCSLRGSQALLDWADGYYQGSRWSDATEATLPAGTNRIELDGSATPITSGDLADVINTHVGASWIPASCNRPWCGNLLRGDVISHLDENGDGVWDNTWIDSNFNGIRENGEVDRTRAEQFAWGITSVLRDLSHLSLVQGNVSPPGISRMRARLALGDAALDPDAGCDGDIANPACHNAVVAPPDLTGSTPDDADDDPAVFGRCDPDRPEFTSLLAINPDRAQRALDNCLWFFASFPVTAPSPGSFDALHNQLDSRLRPGGGLDPITDPSALRDSWIDQRVVKYVTTNTPEQDFAQSFLVTYNFISAPDTDDIRSAIYHNEWRLAQSDTGTHTYPYNFLIQHTTEARRRGFTQDHAVPISECVPPLPDPACDGFTNPTVDPFWGKAIAGVNPDGTFILNFDNEFEFFADLPCDEVCRESGVGHETGFNFLLEQFVEGYLLSCLNCDHPAPESTSSVTFDIAWPEFPSFTPLPHPPPLITDLPVLP
ncbi:MAG: hypothetical protein ACOYXR_10415 [Nitrospirota bacterium]